MSSPAGAPQLEEKKDDSLKTWIWIGKIVFAPVILLLQAIRIYVLGCIGVYFFRIGRGLACGLCVCCNMAYKDKKFPPSAESIGEWKGKTPQQINEEIVWKRIGDICAAGSKEGAKLFSGKIEPKDICQGSLGDCWLMSSLACLANQEGAIQQVFLTQEYNAYGRYRVRLYDTPRERWQTIVLDDYIPCDAKTGQPIFAKPNGDEAWVLLLEKAMAKFKGSYSALDGGFPLWALEALTSDYVFKFRLDEKGQWTRADIVHKPNGKGGYDVMLAPTDDVLDSDGMFETMLWYNRKRSVIGASTSGGDDTQNTNGIVHGHAYAVIAVKRVDRFQLIRLRNPWGTFEWTGDWSDSSPLWQQYPKVARAVEHTGSVDDGTFWMEWKDCQAYFKNLDFCSMTTGWDNIQLDIHEHMPYMGPTVGCAKGCLNYWFCCKGARALFCARKVRSFERPAKGCCAGCMP